MLTFKSYGIWKVECCEQVKFISGIRGMFTIWESMQCTTLE